MTHSGHPNSIIAFPHATPSSTMVYVIERISAEVDVAEEQYAPEKSRLWSGVAVS